jgi:hypothetical protein
MGGDVARASLSRDRTMGGPPARCESDGADRHVLRERPAPRKLSGDDADTLGFGSDSAEPGSDHSILRSDGWHEPPSGDALSGDGFVGRGEVVLGNTLPATDTLRVDRSV